MLAGETDFKLSNGTVASDKCKRDISCDGDDSLRVRVFNLGGDDGITGVSASGKAEFGVNTDVG